MRQKFTLSIDVALVEKIKIQAVLEKTDVSTITEELYREYLDKRKKEGRGKSKS
jgi:hypothetical protein